MKTKLETLVNFPIHGLDLTKYVANKNNNRPHVYELYALANHYGNMGSGHYTAYVKVCSFNEIQYATDISTYEWVNSIICSLTGQKLHKVFVKYILNHFIQSFILLLR